MNGACFNSSLSGFANNLNTNLVKKGCKIINNVKFAISHHNCVFDLRLVR